MILIDVPSPWFRISVYRSGSSSHPLIDGPGRPRSPRSPFGPAGPFFPGSRAPASRRPGIYRDWCGALQSSRH
ncbi:hypothetical protein AC630_40070 [Bradyrhizobium sp. AS23.2]|nr:hypothetical protein AC630_40070 [Bradyrhizobium sp. AS23.2]